MQHVGKFEATCNTEAPGVGLRQGISFICKYHLLSEAHGSQCKWYLGRSPLLCRSTMVNRIQVHTKLATPFSNRGHLGHLFAVKTCLSGKRASTYSFRKHLVQNGCRVLFYRGTMVYRSTIIHTGSLGVGLQQGIRFICEHHLIAEYLGCQCKW